MGFDPSMVIGACEGELLIPLIEDSFEAEGMTPCTDMVSFPSALSLMLAINDSDEDRWGIAM